MRTVTRFSILSAAVFVTVCLNQPCGHGQGATSQGELPKWALGPFLRPPGLNPIITPNPSSVFPCPMRDRPVHWEFSHTFNPCAAVIGQEVFLFYRAEDDTGTGIGTFTTRLGKAISGDGMHFKRFPQPAFYPDKDSQKEYEWPGGTADPRLIESPTGEFILTYSEQPKHPQNPTRIGIAVSRDLITWDKKGPAFLSALGGRYAHVWSKSGSIVSSLQGGRLKAVQINGKYWMYYGEGVVYIATSTDLISWTPVEDSVGHPKVVLPRRHGYFDSGLVEGGPAAVLTSNGIDVIYNAKNDGSDKELGKGAYAGGQALFDSQDPTRLLERMDQPFYQPEDSWEKTGQYAAGTTFLEGLVYFHSQWFLYYGCADTYVAVAVFDPTRKP